MEVPEIERIWILREEERKKKIPRRILLMFMILFVGSGLITTVVKTAVPRGHRQPPPPASPFNYTEALEKSLEFFEAQKCKCFIFINLIFFFF